MTASVPDRDHDHRAVDSPNQSGSRLASTSAQRLSQHGLSVHEVIGGKYRVERVLGEGAMGVVLAATHLDLDEIVALKFIRREMQDLPDVVSRFAREAKATARIKSEHIANVLDVGVTPLLGPYIVMEYLSGQDLADHLAERGPFSIRRAAEYMMQACEALAIAHTNGITHRDIKPENLFLTRHGELEIIKVLDFGISKAALTGSVFGDDLTVLRTSCLMGTPLYMSPEQIRATAEVDHRTDIWSLGAVLYELLSGKTAFAAETVTKMCAMVLETEPEPLDVRCPEASPELLAVVSRCLQKDPEQRFQNVAELAVALLPFAPSRSKIHAERALCVLRASGVDVGVAQSNSSWPAPSGSAPRITVPPMARLPSASLAGSTRAPTRRTSRVPPEAEVAPLRSGPRSSVARWALLAGALGLALATLAVITRNAALKGVALTAPSTPGQQAANRPALRVDRNAALPAETVATAAPGAARPNASEHRATPVTRRQSIRPAIARDARVPPVDSSVRSVLPQASAAAPQASAVKAHVGLVGDRPSVKLVE